MTTLAKPGMYSVVVAVVVVGVVKTHCEPPVEIHVSSMMLNDSAMSAQGSTAYSHRPSEHPINASPNPGPRMLPTNEANAFAVATQFVFTERTGPL